MVPPPTPVPTEARDGSDETLLSTTLLVDKRDLYQYQPLPPYTIRLLHLLPADDESSPIRCELSELRLDQNGHRPSLYEALSYTWGGSEQTCPINIQNKTIGITANLHEALVRLRHSSLLRVLWVDAICIDQGNRSEKQIQIPLMYSIYTQASSVLVWLGEAPNGDDEVFDDLCVMADKRAADPNHEERMISEGVCLLLQHNRFQRIWVLQEVAAARRVQILRGHSGIDGYAFCLAMESLQNSLRSNERYQQLHRIVRPITYLMRQSIFRPLRQNSATVSHGQYRLGELVDMFHTHQASISSDKIYALMSMSSDGSVQSSLTPDYNLPFHEVLKRLVEYLFLGQATVSTQQDRAAAVIRGKGRFIGYIESVKPITTSNQQNLQVRWYGPASLARDSNWDILASAMPLQPDDLVYLFHGTSTPVILRIQGYVAVVLTTTISLPLHATKKALGELYRMDQRPLTMIWDWDYSPDDLDRVQSYNLWTRARPWEVPSSEADLDDTLNDLHQLVDLAFDLYEIQFPKMADGLFTQWIQRCNTELKTTEPQTSDTSLYAALQEHIRDIFRQAPKHILQQSAFWAYEQGQQTLFSLLLDVRQVFLSSEGRDHQTIFSLAIERRDEAIIKELLKRETNIDRRFQTANDREMTGLRYAAGAGCLGIVEILLDGNATVNETEGRTALHAAAEGGHLAIVERLLLANADVNGQLRLDLEDPLVEAAGKGHLAIVERLLLAHADVDAEEARSNRTEALRAAAFGGHLAVVERLLLTNADVNTATESHLTPPLRAAAGMGHLAVVERLLQTNAEVNSRSVRGLSTTALESAASWGHLAIVERLLLAIAGDDVAAKRQIETARRRAAENGHVDVVKRLLLTNADINAMAGNERESVVDATSGIRDIANLLRSLRPANAKIDNEIAGVYGPALYSAVRQDQLAVVQLLLAEGAAANGVVYVDLEIALALAERSRRFAIAECIRRAQSQWVLQKEDGYLGNHPKA